MTQSSDSEPLLNVARFPYVAHYKDKYGELPLEEHQAMLEANDIDEDLAKLLASGVLEMVSVLALVHRWYERTTQGRWVQSPSPS